MSNGENEQQRIEGRDSEVCEGKWKPLTEGNQEKGPERGEDVTAYLLPWVLNMAVLEDAELLALQTLAPRSAELM